MNAESTAGKHYTDPWAGFEGQSWQKTINVRDFIQHNYVPFLGDASFLSEPLLDADERQHGAAEGFPAGNRAAPSDISPKLSSLPPEHQTRQEREGVFCSDLGATIRDLDTAETRACRASGIVTAPPDVPGLGRFVGDYRRIALYGVDRLVQDKESEILALDARRDAEDPAGHIGQLARQIRMLNCLVDAAASHGLDISRPAGNAVEALQWMHFGYLYARRRQSTTAIPIGRTTDFLDIYIQRDLESGCLSEALAQRLIDDFVFETHDPQFPQRRRTFSRQKAEAVETLGGMGEDGRPLVTKTSFRYLHSLNRRGTAPGPGCSVLWSTRLPRAFAEFAALTAIETGAVQFVSDELVRGKHGDDAAVVAEGSALAIGKGTQFPGAYVNLPKALLYAINGGHDEQSGERVSEDLEPILDDVLDYQTVVMRFEGILEWLARTAVRTANVARHMRDKRAHQPLEMALYDRDPTLAMTYGVEGLATVTDSLSAIRYAQVRPIRDEDGVAFDFQIRGDYPAYGNNDDRVDQISACVMHDFRQKLNQIPTPRGTFHSPSLCPALPEAGTGWKTGCTPDGRRAGLPFAAGANPTSGRGRHGYLVSALSAAKLSYDDVDGGIAFTTTVHQDSLGQTSDERTVNLVGVLNGFVVSGGYHFKIDVVDDVYARRNSSAVEIHPLFSVRLPGYANNLYPSDHHRGESD